MRSTASFLPIISKVFEIKSQQNDKVKILIFN